MQIRKSAALAAVAGALLLAAPALAQTLTKPLSTSPSPCTGPTPCTGTPAPLSTNPPSTTATTPSPGSNNKTGGVAGTTGSGTWSSGAGGSGSGGGGAGNSSY